MSSKTVWVAGGLVLAVAAVAYLGYYDSPAGKDASGTIVQAKRHERLQHGFTDRHLEHGIRHQRIRQHIGS
jgi:hypothetical protein